MVTPRLNKVSLSKTFTNLFQKAGIQNNISIDPKFKLLFLNIFYRF